MKECCKIGITIVKNPWVHGLNKSRVHSDNGGTIYRVAISRVIFRRAVATSNAKTAFMRGMKCNAALFIIIFRKKQRTIKRKKRWLNGRGLATCRRRKIDAAIAVELRLQG